MPDTDYVDDNGDERAWCSSAAGRCGPSCSKRKKPPTSRRSAERRLSSFQSWREVCDELLFTLFCWGSGEDSGFFFFVFFVLLLWGVLLLFVFFKVAVGGSHILTCDLFWCLLKFVVLCSRGFSESRLVLLCRKREQKPRRQTSWDSNSSRLNELDICTI